MRTTGGGSDVTVSNTSEATPVLPAGSTARAPNRMEVTPAGIVKNASYGGSVLVANTVSFTRRSTRVTRTSSDACTTSVMTLASGTNPAAGDVICTVGFCVSREILIVTAEEFVVLPAKSAARAVRVTEVSPTGAITEN